MSGMLSAILVFLVSFVAGYALILKIPALLHTPLMSMTNAISGVTIIGALLLFTVRPGATVQILGGLAIVLATFNVMGGFVVTDRMLKMFKKRQGQQPITHADSTR